MESIVGLTWKSLEKCKAVASCQDSQTNTSIVVLILVEFRCSLPPIPRSFVLLFGLFIFSISYLFLSKPIKIVGRF